MASPAVVGEVFSSEEATHENLLINICANLKSVQLKRWPAKAFPATSFFSEDFAFVTLNNTILYDPVSAAKFIFRYSGEEEACVRATASEEDDFIEWVEWKLIPFRTAQSPERELPEEITSIIRNFIDNRVENIRFAEIAVWWALHPILGNEKKIAGSSLLPVADWFQKLGELPAFSEAIKATAVPKSVASSPIVPVKGKRNILVTSALPYVNNVPHLGNIIGCVLSADVYARYCRRRKYNVLYICGTDEYGTATETKAFKEKTTPQQICDKFHAIHAEVYKWFDISFDKFGRTSTPKQTEISQAIFHSLMKQNRLIEDTMEQPYCDTCQRFLADRFVEGTCPTPGCGFDDARGDQCDKCGKLLNPTELINPRCNICGNPPRIRQTEHLFLDLPALKDQLEAYVTATSAVGGWSSNSIQTTNAWIRDGLKPRCITRDLKWGVPVPLEKYKDKVFYVWFDAPIGYISITAGYTDSWREWWQDPDGVELVQFMGKDNVPFHTVIFPCTLLGTGEQWTKMRTISVTEYLNYEGGKFSKSRGIGVFGTDAEWTGIPVEVWRYYLLTNRPEVSDTMFTWSDLQAKQNNELLKNLGNFVNRALAFLAKPEGEGFGSVVPDCSGAELDELVADIGQKTGQTVQEYIDNMEKVKLKAGLKAGMALSNLGNLFLQDSKFWKLYKENHARCCLVMRTALGMVHVLATVLEPFMPSFSAKVLSQLNMPESSLSLSEESGDVSRTFRPWEIMPRQHRIGVPEPIFAEMRDEEVAKLRARFAGSQQDREDEEAARKEKAAGAASQKPPPEKKAEKKGAKKGSDASALPVDVSRLDLRVGVIQKVQKHPDADSLYVEEIDLGEAAPRTVVSGLVNFIPIEELQGRRVCVLCNLKPVSMRGVKSHAMVLAASSADHSKVELLCPPEGAKAGDRISAVGFEGEADAVLNPKKNVWESVQKELRISEELVACYKGVPLGTADGPCTVASLQDASIG